MVARGTACTVIAAGWFAGTSVMSMPVSLRMWTNKSERSRIIVGLVRPVARTVIGPSNRVNRGTARPLSMRKDRSSKSWAISVFERAAGAIYDVLKARIGGITLDKATAWLGGGSCRTGAHDTIKPRAKATIRFMLQAFDI